MVVICEDLAPLLQTKLALQESEERFRLSFSDAAVGMAHLATDCRMLRTNRKLQEMLGYSSAELMQLTLQAITHPDDHEPDRVLLQQLLHGEIREYTREKRYVHKNGSYIWVSVAVSFMRDSRGRTRFIAVIEDVSQRKQVEHEILHLANHDALTGLPNRALMQARLYDVILQAQDRDGQIAVLFLDLDRFKNINDSLGHHIGDQVIIEAGKRIAGVMRNSDTVARQGGDEFLVLLGEVTSFTDVETVARRILDAIARPMILQDHEVYISASIGISMYPKDGRDGVTLMKNADTAMYQAKRSGRGRYEFFGDELNGLALARFKLEGALRHALERHEFVLYYQPQIDIVSNDIVGLEALIRWQSGTSLVAPDEFIPLAEESGLIIPMGEWVLATACRQIKCWHDAGRSDLKMSVNLSGCQFRQQDIVEMVQRILSETGCPASALVLEITESVVMDNPQATAEILRRLSAMGVGLAIDDFGTGYSSLTYLKRFPIDTLKIDRSFIRDLVTDNDDAAIVKSVIALAHAMNRNIVAEGVETEAQLEFLRLHGCNQAQGYYSGKPLPAHLTTPILLMQRLSIIGDSSMTVDD